MNSQKDRQTFRHKPHYSPSPETTFRPRAPMTDQSVWISDEEYVDWNKRGRITPASNRNKVLSFAAPFVVAFLVFIFFDYLLKDKSGVKPVSSKEFAARQAESRQANTPPLPQTKSVGAPDAQTDHSLATATGKKTTTEEASDAGASASNSAPSSPADELNAPDASGETTAVAQSTPVPEPEMGASDANDLPAPVVEETTLNDAPIAEETPDAPSLDEAPPAEEPDVPAFDDNLEANAPPTVETDALETTNPLDPLGVDVLPVEDADSSQETIAEPEQSLAVDDANEVGQIADSFALDLDDLTDEHDDEGAGAQLDAPQAPEIDVEAARSELAQIEFLFGQIKAADARDVDADLEALDEPIAQARLFLENAPDELADAASGLLSQMEDFQQTLELNADFYRRLEALDSASLDEKETREFFAPWRASSSEESNADKSEIVRVYDADFTLVASALDTLDAVDKWNAFMQEHGERLERFHASPEDAKLALTFLEELRAMPGVPEEIKLVEKKEKQWRFDAEHEFPTQRKIVLMIESELHQKYWTYMPSRDKVYYLPAEPRVGENVYVANAQGAVAKVRIPADAPELEQKVSPQKQFLEELVQKAWKIPDSLRNEDVAQWYAQWSDFLKTLQETKALDPILQYKFFQETAGYLRQSDYYYASRLEPILRVLNAPQLDEQTTIDRFQTEKSSLVDLRNLAISRVDFLPKDHLNVDKSTEELDAKAARFATLYRRVGWLDKNFNNEWLLRRPKDAEIPVGDLYVVYEDASESEPKWFKIGSADGRLITLNVASDSIPRGSIVLCRIPLTKGSTVATRSAVDALFKR